jgi:hypothetical protein
MCHPSLELLSAVLPIGKKSRGTSLRWLFLSSAVVIASVVTPSASALNMLADITTNTVTDFGTYKPRLVNVTPSAAPYTIASDFSNVVNFSQFTFTDAQKNLLRHNGFVAIPKTYPSYGGPAPFGEMYDVYNYARDNDLPIFVTVDALLHTYHELYDYALRTIETQRFLRDLDRLTSAMITASRAQFNQATNSKVKAAAQLNVAYFAVATKLLSTTATIPADVAATVTAEIALINAHTAIALSPIFGYPEDYTQYVPRGHYTLSPELERYFRAMMWYGRMTFHSEAGVVSLAKAREATRRALLITQLMHKVSVTTEPALTVWERIYLPTVFFVGKSDDLTVYKYAAIARTIYGANLASVPVNSFGDEAKLTAFLNQVAALPPPLIAADEWGKGFRFMGQRFIPDSYMFEEMVLPRVPGRTMPRGLDVMAILGSPRAFEILDHVYHDTNYTSYVLQLNALKAEFAAMDDAVWAQNLYWNWLYCLMPMLAPKGAGFPTYMRAVAWMDKDLACVLGSWAELRHDTLLYAKQSSSMGASSQAFRDAFVEANPWAFARMASLTRLMIDGLSDQGLLLSEFGGRLRDLEQLLLSLKVIAEKELTNQPLTILECRLIRMIGRRLANLTIFEPRGDFTSDDDMALIADVHSDYVTGNCLEVGVGRPLTIYVVNKSENQLVIAIGSAFSYYEFPQPLSNRLTDEAWRQMLSSASPPTLQPWLGSYIDLSANFNLGTPRNAHDPYGNPYGTGWSAMTIRITAMSSWPDTCYNVRVRLPAYEVLFTSIALEATSGGYRKVIALPWVSGGRYETKVYEGVLALRGWPIGLVTATAYAPQNMGLFNTTTFSHAPPAAMPTRLWQRYY